MVSYQQIPKLPVLLRCPDQLREQAAYSFVMLGLICGFDPEFISENEAHSARIVYSSDASQQSGCLFLPLSLDAWQFLSVKNPYPADRAVEVSEFDCRYLSLFPVADDGKILSGNARRIGSDVIAATFFFLSLHEEWSCVERDQFGRFQSKNSLLGRRRMLHVPVVSLYAKLIVNLLAENNLAVASGARFEGKRAALCLTHDIDYVSKWSPGIVYREVGKNFFINKLEEPFGNRMRRLGEFVSYLNPARDPYKVSLMKILELEKRCGVQATFFLKTGGTDKRDISYRLNGSWLRKAMQGVMEDGHEIGLHPSFRTVDNEHMFLAEKLKLDQYVGRKTDAVRQHYLRFRYPSTWQMQRRAGLVIDSTLGFAEHEGFRNGTCHPFLGYDHNARAVLPIWEMPLLAMDGTLTDYRGLDPGQALDVLQELLSTVEEAAGCGAILFHNTCFDRHDFPGWDRVFTSTVEEAAGNPALYLSTIQRTLQGWIRSGGYEDMSDVYNKIQEMKKKA
jgi:hypothetical protein